MFSNGTECRNCHTEHRGAHGALTNLASFDHDCAAFKLTGKHTTVSCASCHVNDVYKGTPHDCAACHAEPKVHLGRFGTGCARCHSTSTWEGATFEHSFPLTHGGGGKKRKACAVCHTEANSYQTYTCYGCHRHDPGKTAQKHLRRGVVDIDNCVACHPTGRKVRRQAREDGPLPELVFDCPGGACGSLPTRDEVISRLLRGSDQ
jgi:hypothetical protein